MTRKEILEAALKCVNGDRDEQYGKPENSFQIIADLWNAYLHGRPFISPADAAAMMALMKLARISVDVQKNDSWVDLAGYAACGGEIAYTEQAGT